MRHEVKVFLKLLVVVGLLGLGVLPLHAQDATPLLSGEPVAGSIDLPGGLDEYSYEGLTGEEVLITAKSLPDSKLDTVLELYDPAGFLITKNDDANLAQGVRDSQITAILPYDGQYQIVVRGFADQSTGAYEVELLSNGIVIGSDDPTPDVPATPLPPSDQGSIQLNEALSGTLAAGETATYSFTPESDLLVQVNLSSEAFDTYLEVYDAEGTLLGLDDDSGDGVNSLLANLSLSAGETYQIVVRSFGVSGSGDYELLISEFTLSVQSGSISYGETISGTIDPGQQVEYSFDGAEGDVIAITTAGSFDSFLELRDADGNILTTDDDAGGNLLPMILDYTLPADGSYLIVLRGYNNSASGDFMISLHQGGLSAVQDEVLALGDSVSGFLPAGQSATYFYDGSAGELITILVEAAIDTTLELEDADGNILQVDDDSGGNFNPRISNFELPETAQYRIVLRAFSQQEMGNYSLTLREGNPEDVLESQPIALGESLEGEISREGRAAFNFEVPAEALVSIQVDSDFDAVLEVLSSTGRYIAGDDDSGGDLQPLLENLELPESGTYTILVYGYDEDDAGAFTLSLQEGSSSSSTDPDPLPPVEGGNAINYGETVEAELNAGETVTYSFGANAGDRVRISVDAAFDAYLDLLDAEGNRIASDDDSGEGFDPLIDDLLLDAEGVYRIVLSTFGGQGSGNYTLNLEVISGDEDNTPEGSSPPDNTENTPGSGAAAGNAGTGVMLEPGSPVEGMLTPETAQRFQFQGAAGDLISLAASPATLDSSIDLFLELYGPDGSLLASDDDAGWRLNPALSGLELPVDGTYDIVVRSFGGNDEGPFTLTLADGTVFLAPGGSPASLLPEGDSFDLQLDENGIALYEFQAGADEAFTVESNLAFEVYSPDFGDLSVDGESSSFSTIAAGTYLLLFYGEPNSSATASVMMVAGIEPFTTVAGDLLADEPVSGRVAVGETQQWTFTPLLPGEYSFSLTNAGEGTYDPYLRVLAEDGSTLAEDDDSGGGFDALISALSLEAGSPITIEVTSFAGQVSGDYLLAVTTQAQAPVEALDAGPLTVGEIASASLALPGQVAQFSFTVESEGTFDFVVEGLALPIVDVLDADDSLVARGIGSLAGQKLEPGNYIVQIYDRVNSTGDFTLTVNATE